MKGIDVSAHQGIINWNKVKSQIDFAIIRATFGLSIDSTAKRNIEECIRLKIPFGVYCYSYALTEEQGKKETNFLLDFIRPYKKQVLFPVCIDMEDADAYKEKNGMPTNEVLINICENFCKIVSSNGFVPLIYSMQSWFQSKLKSDKLKKYSKWLAWWYKKAEFDKGEYPIWQYSSEGKIDGIEGKVDLNECFLDFPSSISYLQLIEKMQIIRMKTGLEDLTLTFFNCYKYRNELIEKLVNRLDKEKVIYEPVKYDKWSFIRIEFELEDKTIQFFQNYIYAEELKEKLFHSITKEGV